MRPHFASPVRLIVWEIVNEHHSFKQLRMSGEENHGLAVTQAAAVAQVDTSTLELRHPVVEL
jgi:hypothetical protein